MRRWLPHITRSVNHWTDGAYRWYSFDWLGFSVSLSITPVEWHASVDLSGLRRERRIFPRGSGVA